MRDFFGCYLLVSKSPQGKGRTYIGFTVNPRRRIRQHNGLITAGAWKTSKWRPWEMTLVLYGFPTKIQALQFEWAWQHPQRSVIVRPIAQALGSKKLTGVRGKILLMLSMLHESPWRHFPLTLQYLQPEYAAMVKENVASAPAHVRVFTAPMEDLPRALNDMDEDCSEGDGGGEEGNEEQRIGGTQQAGRGGGGGSKGQHRQGAAGEDGAEDGGGGDSDGSGGGGTSSAGGEGSDDEPVEIDGCQEKQRLPAAKAAAQAACGSHQPAAAGTAAAAAARQRCHICQVAIQRHILVCSTCGVYFHLDCLAAKWCSAEAASGGGQERQRFGGVPEQGHCPACGTLHGWMTMLQGMQTVGWGNKPRGRRGKRVGNVSKTAAAKADAEAASLTQDGPLERDGAKPTAAGKGRKRAVKPKTAAAADELRPPAQPLPDLQRVEAHASGCPYQDAANAQPPEQQQQLLPAAKGRKPRAADKEGAAAKPRRKATGKAAAAAAPSDAAAGAAVTAQDVGSEAWDALAGGVVDGGGAYGAEPLDAAAVKPAKGRKRAVKPRAPAGAGDAAPGAAAGTAAAAVRAGLDMQSALGDSGGAWALGIGTLADAPAAPSLFPESPSKRPCKARPPAPAQSGNDRTRGRPQPQQPYLERDGPSSASWRPQDAKGSTPPAGGGSADGSMPAEPEQPPRDASPLPLWQRLQLRAQQTAAAAADAQARPRAAAAGAAAEPSPAAVVISHGGLGLGWSSWEAGSPKDKEGEEEEDDDPGLGSPGLETKPAGRKTVTQAKRGGAGKTSVQPRGQVQLGQPRRRAPEAWSQDVIVLGSTSEEGGGDSDEEKEGAAPFAAGSDSDSEGGSAGRADVDFSKRNSSPALAGQPNAAFPAPPFPVVPESSSSLPTPRAMGQAQPPTICLSPMAESPPRHRLDAVTATAAATEATATPSQLHATAMATGTLSTPTPSLAFGSPGWAGSGPNSGSKSSTTAEAASAGAGSAGGGVTTLMAQLQCGGSTRDGLGSPGGDADDPMRAAEGAALEGTHAGDVAAGAAHYRLPYTGVAEDLRDAEQEDADVGPAGMYDVHRRDEDAAGGESDNAGGASERQRTYGRPSICHASTPGQPSPSHGGDVAALGGGDGTAAATACEGGKQPQQRRPPHEVVDLCTPLPLSMRLARKAAEASNAAAAAAATAAPGAAGASSVEGAQGLYGKRLRSPKPPGLWQHGCSDALSPLQPKVPVSTGPLEGITVLPGGGALQGQGPSDIGPSGWSVSPWPLRRRREGPDLMLCDDEGDEEQEEAEEAGLPGRSVGALVGVGRGEELVRATATAAVAASFDDDDVIVID